MAATLYHFTDEGRMRKVANNFGIYREIESFENFIRKALFLFQKFFASCLFNKATTISQTEN